MRRYTLTHQLLRLPALIILPITYGIIKLFSANPQLVDWIYCGKIYPNLTDLVNSFTRRLPFSLAEVSLIALVSILLLSLVIRIIKVITFRREALMRLVSLVITAAIVASYLLFAFYAMWGFNFYRTGIDKRMALPQREYGSEQLAVLCRKLTEEAAALREKVDEDASGVFKISDPEAAFAAVEAAYTEYGEINELFAAKAPKVKSVMLSRMLSHLRILGIYSGFTAEPNINRDQPDLYLCSTAAHETAHYYGWAREDEANFIAYLVCSRSANVAVAYSAAMNVLTDCMSALAYSDAKEYHEIRALYSDGMSRDLEAYSEYYKLYANDAAGELSDHINDSYLKANGQEHGINSYQDDVLLLLRYFDNYGLFKSAQLSPAISW